MSRTTRIPSAIFAVTCFLAAIAAPASLAIFGAVTCGMATETKKASPDPKTLLQAYEKTLVPYRQFKAKWTERNAELKEGGEPEWMNRHELAVVRDRDRQKHSITWRNDKDAGRAERNWEETLQEKGKTEVSIHPARPGTPPDMPLVIANLHLPDDTYTKSLGRGIPTAAIRGTWIPTFLQSAKLSAKTDTLEGCPVDVLQGASGDVTITLWLDPALKHVPRRISYHNSNPTPSSLSATLVWKAKRFEEKGGVFVPVESVVTSQCPAHPEVMLFTTLVDGKPVIKQVPQKDKNGRPIMAAARSGLTELNLQEIQFNPTFAADDFKFSKPIPEGTKVNASYERSIRHVSYEWRQGKIVKIVAPAIKGKFNPATNARSVVAEKLKTAKWSRNHVLVIFGANTWKRCEALEETFLSSPDTLLSLVDDDGIYTYQVVFADLTNPANRALATEYGLTGDNRESPGMTVLDANGRVLCSRDLAAFQRDGKYDAAMLDAFLKQWEVSSEDALDLLRSALQQAAKEQKKPFVIVTGAYCPPCRRLTAFLERRQDVLNRDYILVKIDTDRMTHVAEAMTRIGYERNRMIPWYVILSPTGEKLITSMGPTGNIGFPSGQPGIQHFVTMLRRTASHLSPEQLKSIEDAMAAANKAN